LKGTDDSVHPEGAKVLALWYACAYHVLRTVALIAPSRPGLKLDLGQEGLEVFLYQPVLVSSGRRRS
jgi:hypothetical protein